MLIGKASGLSAVLLALILLLLYHSASSKVFTLDLRQFGAAEEVEEELETDEPTENES